MLFGMKMLRHSRKGGNPVFQLIWTPAFAGVTSGAMTRMRAG